MLRHPTAKQEIQPQFERPINCRARHLFGGRFAIKIIQLLYGFFQKQTLCRCKILSLKTRPIFLCTPLEDRLMRHFLRRQFYVVSKISTCL